MATSESGAWFYFPYSKYATYKDMGEWAAIAAKTLPVEDVDDGYFACDQLMTYTSKWQDRHIAELILEFFIRGRWPERMNPDDISQLHIRLRISSLLFEEIAYMEGEVHQYAIRAACLLIACVASEYWRETGMSWFSEKIKNNADIKLDFKSESIMNCDTWKYLSHRHSQELWNLSARMGTNIVDEVRIPHYLTLSKFTKDLIENQAKIEGSDVEAYIFGLVAKPAIESKQQ